MIKEIETAYTTEVLEDGQQIADFEHTPDLVSATLSSNGEVMTAKVNRLLKTGCLRKVALYYMLPKYEQQMVAEYELGTFGPTDMVDETTEYVFDLSPVLSTIVHTAPEQLADDTITIRLYTYEANISTDYGSKTLHVPYTVSYPSNMVVPASTDGWYALRVSDIEEWLVDTQYYVDDIVWYSGSMYNCLVNSLGDIPALADDTWILVDAELERNLFEFGHEPSYSIATLLNCNILVTRYVKQKYIYEMLVKTNYKRHDNIKLVTQLEKLFAMREAAVVHLNNGNPLMARHMLDLITIEVNGFTTNNGERKVIEMITNFTI
jgi:hypothetical protein